MVIYVDVLVSVNFIVDFLLLSLTSLLSGIDIRAKRQIPAALLGGFSSLYIFFEFSNLIFDIFFRIFCSSILVLICLGIKPIKGFFKFLLFYYLSACLLGGIMQFCAGVLRLDFVAVNNSYFYLNISPFLLIITTLIIYLTIKLFLRFKKSRQIDEQCKITLFFKERKMTFNGLVDNGNKAKDILGKADIIFISLSSFIEIIGTTPSKAEEEYKNRFRIIPINTVNGSSVGKGIRIDKAEIYCGKNLFELNKPILIASNSNFDNNFDVIISSDILFKMPVKTFKERVSYES